MPALHVESRPVARLRPSPRNPRTHSRKQIRQIADSIRTFGFTNPVLIDDAGMIIAGHGRVEAAKLLGYESVPTICLSAMTAAQKRAYVIADNKLALNAGWDEQLLALELQYLSELELDVEIGVIGFETAEIDLFISGLAQAPDDAADQLPDLEGPAVSRPGDLWQVDGHRLLCADATHPQSYARLMAGARAQMVFSDPPYNVPIDGHVCGLGQVRAPRVRDGGRRDEPGAVHRLSRDGLWPSGGAQLRRVDPLHLHGLAPYRRAAAGGPRALQRAQEPLRLD
jgi:hypothetical protein